MINTGKSFLLQPHLSHSPRMVYWFLALSTLSSETHLVLSCWNRTERIFVKSLYIYCSQARSRSSVLTFYWSILPPVEGHLNKDRVTCSWEILLQSLLSSHGQEDTQGRSRNGNLWSQSTGEYFCSGYFLQILTTTDTIANYVSCSPQWKGLWMEASGPDVQMSMTTCLQHAPFRKRLPQLLPGNDLRRTAILRSLLMKSPWNLLRWSTKDHTLNYGGRICLWELHSIVEKHPIMRWNK